MAACAAHNQQLLLTARWLAEAARALRARAAFCCNAPQQNCGRYAYDHPFEMTSHVRGADSFSELRVAFSRQRRGLMGSSAAVALFEASEVSLREVSLLGTRFELGHPTAITGGLWLIWAYYLIRYLQHLQDLRDDGPGRAFHVALEARMLQVAKGQFEPRFLRQNSPFPPDSAPRFEYEHISSLPVVSLGIWAFKLTGTLFADGKDSSKSVLIDDQSVSVTPTPKDRALAWFRVALGTRYFSEYALPLLVALAPPVAALFRMTRG